MNTENLRVPSFCPMCNLVMKGKSTYTYYDHGVCINCFIHFIEGREEKWKSGWRPSEEQLKAYLIDRTSSSF